MSDQHYPTPHVAAQGVTANFQSWCIVNGDVTQVASMLNAEHFDALLSDPPYGLSFMNKRWDYDVPTIDAWAALLRVLKPGAPILAFGGSRTYHRLVCAAEDAGVEVRDQLQWLYGSGFPKSQDASKAIDAAAGAVREVIGQWSMPGRSSRADGYGLGKDSGDLTAPATPLAQRWEGYGTALKPAFEPIMLGRKPLVGTLASNIAAHGVGPLAIDACRIEASGRPLIIAGKAEGQNVDFGSSASKAAGVTDVGRWPANVILDEAAGAVLDAQSGNRPGMSGGGQHREGYEGGMFGGIDSTGTARSDSGGASRFFYCAKASRSEREAGLGHLPLVTPADNLGRDADGAGLQNPRAGAGRSSARRNTHPTVKPLALVEYLAKLIKPPTGAAKTGCRILVPYSGSGSEIIGALQAGWSEVVGIELDPQYVQIAKARIVHFCGGL